MKKTMPRHKALTACRKFGADIRTVKATGEIRIIFPNGDRVVMNNRRNEVTRDLMKHLRRRGLVPE